MKKSVKIALIAAPIVMGASVGGYFLYNQYKKRTPAEIENSLKIASWNLQIFGEKKANNPELMQSYVNVLTNYNIIFIEEIRDSSETAFPTLCSMLKDYEYKASSRAGRSNSKEQYGVLYRKGQVNIQEFNDFNPDAEDRWERQPIQVVFNIGTEYTLNVFAIHTDPDDVKKEITALERITTNSGNVIVIGDLNASGQYYKRDRNTNYSNWNWVIADGEDTTVSKNNSYTYDRVIANPDASREVISHGIYTNGINKEMSDHYLIWVQIVPKER